MIEWPEIRHHSAEAQDILQKASLSRESELTREEAERLNHLADKYHGGTRLASIPGHRIREYIMPRKVSGSQASESEPAADSIEQGESIMAKAKSNTKARKSTPTKAQIVTVAKLRRGGATWDEVIADTGIRTNSSGFRELLEAAGFDKYGRKGGRGESKAKGWGSAKLNGKSKATKAKGAAKGTAKKKVVRRKTKATAKK